MSDDWRSRSTMTAHDALKVAAAILGLLLACILLLWVATRFLRPAPPAAPSQPASETGPMSSPDTRR
jgi:hypothetical protein